MKCPRCGNEQTDGAFCTKCGAPMNQNNGYNVPPQQQNNNCQQQNMNNGGYYQQQNTNYNGYGQPNQNMNQQPRKEKFYEKTWLIVLACIFLPPVGIALMWISNKPKNLAARIIITVVLGFYTLGALVSGSSSNKSSNTTQKTSTTETEGSKKQSKKNHKKYVDNITAVATKPNDYKGDYIKFGGYVFSVDETDDKYALQIFIDEDHNNSVILEVSKSLIANQKISEGDYIKADAKIDGTHKGETIVGVKSSWAYLIADGIEKSTYQDTIGKANTSWEFSDKVIEQHGISVSVTKVEFSDIETRVYVTVVNNSSSTFNLQDYSAKLTQNGSQYETTYNYNADYPEIPSDILPGITANGIIVFDKVEPAQFQLYMEGYSDDWETDFSPFTFDLAQ